MGLAVTPTVSDGMGVKYCGIKKVKYTVIHLMISAKETDVPLQLFITRTGMVIVHRPRPSRWIFQLRYGTSAEAESAATNKDCING